MKQLVYLVGFCGILFHACQAPETQENVAQDARFKRVMQEQSQVTFTNTVTESEVKNIITYEYFYNGGGVAAGDFNNDGLVDLYFTGNQVFNRLYLNKGDFQFEDITETSGTAGTKAWSNGVALVDINSDGFLDIYVSNTGWKKQPHERRNELFVNNGDLTFTESAAEYGIDDPSYSTQSIFLDIDNDNDLDLFVVNRPERTYKVEEASYLKNNELEGASDRLFLNENGKFRDISKEYGIVQNGLGYGLGVAAGDLNKDGWVDLYVSNDYVEHDYLYYNTGESFSEVGKLATDHMSNFGMGVDISDVNNDGWLDIFVADMAPDDNYRQKTMMKPMNPGEFYWAVTNGFHFQYMFNSLQLNNQNNTFSEVAQLAGIATTDWSWATLFEDLDNDGNKDLLVTNGFRKEFSNKDFVKEADKKMGEAMDNSLEERTALMKNLLKKLPETRLQNYLFKSSGDLSYENVSDAWGFQEKSFSNGAVVVDLDNDGRLDVVINNIDEPAYLYRNTAEGGNYLTVALDGPAGNKNGIGAKLTVYTNGQSQYREHFGTRGFHSSNLTKVHFGLGESAADSINIVWPDGKSETVMNPGEEVTLNYANAKEVSAPSIRKKDTPFERITQRLGSPVFHQENPHNDYAREVLLPHKMSQFGPATAVGDVNGDGLEDFYFGSAWGQPARLYEQQADGSFQLSNQQAFQQDAAFEDVGAAFFDLDGDNDLDLYVTSGGNEWSPNTQFYQDRLYINNNGTFSKSAQLPEIRTSNSVVRPHDIDKDGDLDLFVGSRLHPQHYPLSGDSWVLINENGKLTDQSEQYLEDRKLGLVTDARWADLDNDNVEELIVVGEWTAIQIFKNANGQLTDVSGTYGTENLRGWWYSIAIEDLNGDGFKDILAGNLGLNYKYKASIEEPFHIFYDDFDQNGRGDIVLGYHDDDGELYPLRGRQCSSEQIPSIATKFKTYNDYGSANMEEVYGKSKLGKSVHLTANRFASSLLINESGSSFTVQDLPRMAQVSSVNSFIVEDFDSDDQKDVLYAGNLYPVEIETTRNDASHGGLLSNDGSGKLFFAGASDTGFRARGDVKHLAKINLAEGATGILVVRNAGVLDLYKHKKMELN